MITPRSNAVVPIMRRSISLRGRRVRLHGRTVARAVRPDNAKDIPARDGQGNIVDGEHIAVAFFVQVAYFDDRLHNVSVLHETHTKPPRAQSTLSSTLCLRVRPIGGWPSGHVRRPSPPNRTLPASGTILK